MLGDALGGSALVPGSGELILAGNVPAWDHAGLQEHGLEVWCIYLPKLFYFGSWDWLKGLALEGRVSH